MRESKSRESLTQPPSTRLFRISVINRIEVRTVICQKIIAQGVTMSEDKTEKAMLNDRDIEQRVPNLLSS